MNYLEFKNEISKNFLTYLNISISEKQVKQFFDFMNLLIEKNKVMNLTAIVDPNEIIMKHFLDSCFSIKFFNFNKVKCMDVGTGAGFPGLPLAIMCDNSEFVLSDTLGKRIKFIEEVIDKLELDNVVLVKGRAEDLGRDKNYREVFDIVVSRAVARMNVLAEYTMPFVKKEGKLICYKQISNQDVDEVLLAKNAIITLGAKIDKSGVFYVEHRYELDESERRLIEISKENGTPNFYPRKAGIPEKKPIE